MKEYMLIEDYEKLYAKYQHSLDEMFLIAGPVKGKVVWDLCCGGGEIALECMKRGAKKVIAVDQSCSMTKNFPRGAAELEGIVRLEITDVESFLLTADSAVHGFPDIVFCRQAINYWFSERAVMMLADKMVHNESVFIFNTFNTEPSKRPMVKEYDRVYEQQGVGFMEVSWLVGKTVHHVQICEGMAPHVTEFQWISGDEYRRVLGRYFNVGESIRSRTSIYRCSRKNTLL